MRRSRAAAVIAVVLAGCTPEEPSAAPSPPRVAASRSATEVASPSPESESEAPSPSPSAPASSEPAASEPAASAPTLTTETWTLLPEAPQALTEVAGAAFGGALWVAGGFDDSGVPVVSVQIYDPTFGQWQPGPALPEAVHHASLVAGDDSLYLIGGYTSADFSAPTAAVRRFDQATGAWEDSPALPEPRAAGAAAWDGKRVVYAGGVGPDGLSGDVLALEGGAWRRLGELTEPREHLAAASDGEGSVWFLAGRTRGFDTNLASVERVAGESVETVGELPTARGGVAGFYVAGPGACAAGGEGVDGTFSEVECLSADGTVTALPSLAEPRHGIAAASVGGVAYVALGGPEPGLTVSPVLEALALE